MNCPRCGTPMSGGVCPECGFPVTAVRRLSLYQSGDLVDCQSSFHMKDSDLLGSFGISALILREPDV